MTRQQLIDIWAEAGARMEGYFRMDGTPNLSTIAWKQANPGNVRHWDDKHPKTKGYLDLVVWARARGTAESDVRAVAEVEGWRIFKRILSDYLDGRYTGSKTSSLHQMYEKYAPASDNNDPANYARYVAKFISERAGVVIEIDKPLCSYVTA